MKRDRELRALGGELLCWRTARGLTQWGLAEVSGLHRNYIGGIERGERNVGMVAIFKLARGLAIHPAELLSAIP